jgi:hypothetical protein
MTFNTSEVLTVYNPCNEMESLPVSKDQFST